MNSQTETLYRLIVDNHEHKTGLTLHDAKIAVDNMIGNASCRIESHTAPDSVHHARAARLTVMTGENCKVSWQPDSSFPYVCIVRADEGEGDVVHLNQHEPESLQSQLVSELERISRLYAEIAEEVAA